MDEVKCIGLAASVVHHQRHLLLSLPFDVEPIGDVLLDCTGEEDGFLLHDCDLVVVPFRVQIFDIAAIEEHLALVRVVESLDQGHNG